MSIPSVFISSLFLPASSSSLLHLSSTLLVSSLPSLFCFFPLQRVQHYLPLNLASVSIPFQFSSVSSYHSVRPTPSLQEERPALQFTTNKASDPLQRLTIVATIVVRWLKWLGLRKTKKTRLGPKPRKEGRPLLLDRAMAMVLVILIALLVEAVVVVVQAIRVVVRILNHVSCLP